MSIGECLFPHAYYSTPTRNFLNHTKRRGRLPTIGWQAYLLLEYMGVNTGPDTSQLNVLYMFLKLFRESAGIVPQVRKKPLSKTFVPILPKEPSFFVSYLVV